MIQRTTGLVLQVQLETITDTVPRNHRRSKTQYTGILYFRSELHIKSPDYRIGIHTFSGTFVPIFQFHDKRAIGIPLSTDKTES